ncbi:hypothetical protein GHT06_013882 [Daphnia sinensis]|uniref:Ionotropic glutamate receptor C-terminal domain-containing protein n=1 Tax=Daphnia sinensis TaxID=1820382 RepID=A0AAD5PYB9_9CRUS|nr:hypothetical protein GHT06_013882 [Daphnia sinensis]
MSLKSTDLLFQPTDVKTGLDTAVRGSSRLVMKTLHVTFLLIALVSSDCNPLNGKHLTVGPLKCDLMMGTIVMTTSRLPFMDFAEGYSYTTAAVLMPMPESTSNTEAIIKPFQISVRIALYLSIHPIPGTIRSVVSGEKQSAVHRPERLTAGQIIFEVCCILLSQGGKIPKMPRLAVCFVLGSWCLGTFVLISAYNSVLVAYILGSNAVPLVDSLTDVALKPNVRVVVDDGKGIDIVLSSAKDGVYKQLGDKLRSDPKSRCATHRDCINLVKSEKYTYIQGMFGALTMISQDFKATNKCNLAIARRFDPTPGSLSWVLPKKSPNTKIFVKGFMELHQAGLIDFWTRREQEKHQNANFCLNEAKQKQRGKTFDNRTKITLKNFSGAFYILIFGCIASFLCFLCENLSPMLIM